MASILIVDDSIVMRKNLTAILEQAGHTIVGEASNGRQAVMQYLELQPDIVTMDISMPIMSGVEAVKKIIEQDDNAKIIMISAVNQKKMVFNAINNGAKHYIVKPIDEKKVINIINEVIHDSDNETTKKQTNVRTNEQGFQIDNIEGKFIIKFNQRLSLEDHKLLSMAIRGIMFIKPLLVEFNFEEIEKLENNILEPILKLSKEIEESGGIISYSTNSESISQKITAWG